MAILLNSKNSLLGDACPTVIRRPYCESSNVAETRDNIETLPRQALGKLECGGANRSLVSQLRNNQTYISVGGIYWL